MLPVVLDKVISVWRRDATARPAVRPEAEPRASRA
jgi:hypothetical protein